MRIPWRRRRNLWTPTAAQRAELDKMSRAFAKQGITMDEAIRRMERLLPPHKRSSAGVEDEGGIERRNADGR